MKLVLELGSQTYFISPTPTEFSVEKGKRGHIFVYGDV